MTSTNTNTNKIKVSLKLNNLFVKNIISQISEIVFNRKVSSKGKH